MQGASTRTHTGRLAPEAGPALGSCDAGVGFAVWLLPSYILEIQATSCFDFCPVQPNGLNLLAHLGCIFYRHLQL